MKKILACILVAVVLLFVSCDLISQIAEKENPTEEVAIPDNVLLNSIKGKSYTFFFEEEIGIPAKISVNEDGIILFEDEESLDLIFEEGDYTITYDCTENRHGVIVNGSGYWLNEDGTETKVNVVLNRLIEQSNNGLYFSSSCKTYTPEGKYFATELAYQTIIPCLLTEVKEEGTNPPIDEPPQEEDIINVTDDSLYYTLRDTSWNFTYGDKEDKATFYVNEDGVIVLDDNESLGELFPLGYSTMINSNSDLLEIVITGDVELLMDNGEIGTFKKEYLRQITKDAKDNYYFDVYIRCYNEEGNITYEDTAYSFGLGPFKMLTDKEKEPQTNPPTDENLFNVTEDALYYDLLGTGWTFTIEDEFVQYIYVSEDGLIATSPNSSLDEWFENDYTLTINSDKDQVEMIATGDAELLYEDGSTEIFKAVYWAQMQVDSEGNLYFNGYCRCYDDEGNMIHDEPAFYQGTGPYLIHSID